VLFVSQDLRFSCQISLPYRFGFLGSWFPCHHSDLRPISSAARTSSTSLWLFSRFGPSQFSYFRVASREHSCIQPRNLFNSFLFISFLWLGLVSKRLALGSSANARDPALVDSRTWDFTRSFSSPTLIFLLCAPSFPPETVFAHRYDFLLFERAHGG
jgi:hypothetical protein